MESGTQDLRVVKTLDIIKKALCDLILEKKYRQITIADIARTARINRKTFYNHYESIDDALHSIEQEYVSEILDRMGELEDDDFEGTIRVYYEFLSSDDPVRQKLLYGEDYVEFFRRLNSDVLSSEYFMKYCRQTGHEEIATGYMEAVTGIYMRWHDEKEHILSIRKLSHRAAQLILGGLASLT